MATQAENLFQDQNLNVHYGASAGGKAKTSKTVKKGGLGGRKPLGEISNAIKLSPTQLPKKNASMKFTHIKEDNSAVKPAAKAFNVKKILSKAQEKIQNLGRKPLGDISNTENPSVNQASKKNANKKLDAVAGEQVDLSSFADEGFLHNHQECIKSQKNTHANKKLDAVAGEQVDLSSFADEGFLHNHQECIKSQKNTLDMEYFLKMIGFDDDSSLQIAPTSKKLEPESPPPSYLESEETDEWKMKYSSPESPRSPMSPHWDMEWEDLGFPDAADIKLRDSP